MRRTNLARILMAWMLLLTFTTALAIKDFHFHDNKDIHVEQLATTHNAEVHASCFVCDFTMHKANAVKLFSFVPKVVCPLIHKPQALEPIIVYRSVESVNAHAPPFFS